MDTPIILYDDGTTENVENLMSMKKKKKKQLMMISIILSKI